MLAGDNMKAYGKTTRDVKREYESLRAGSRMGHLLEDMPTEESQEPLLDMSRIESPLVAEDTQTTILIPRKDFKNLLGSNGEIIMEISRRSKCFISKQPIKTYNITPEDYYRKVIIEGAPTKIYHCMRLIREELGYDSLKEEFLYKLPMHMSKQLLGRVGEKLRSIEDESGVTILPETEEALGFLHLRIQGTLQQIEHAVGVIRRKTGVVRTRGEVDKEEVSSVAISKVIHIRNLDPGVTEKHLLEATRQFGSVQVIVVAPSGTQALVEFKNIEDAEDCVYCSNDSSIIVSESKVPVCFSEKATLRKKMNVEKQPGCRTVF